MDNTQLQGVKKGNVLNAKAVTTIGFMSAMAFILMFVHFPVKFIGFLELEISDVPALICALTYGPAAGVFVELVKNLLHAMTSSTATVGEIANFIMSSSYVLGVSLVFWYSKSQKRIQKGFFVGTLLLVFTGVVVNYFITLPLYITLYFGGNESALYGMASAMIPAIKDMKTLLLIGFVPFNIVKGAVLSIVTYYVWKKFRKFMVWYIWGKKSYLVNRKVVSGKQRNENRWQLFSFVSAVASWACVCYNESEYK